MHLTQDMHSNPRYAYTHGNVRWWFDNAHALQDNRGDKDLPELPDDDDFSALVVCTDATNSGALGRNKVSATSWEMAYPKLSLTSPAYDTDGDIDDACDITQGQTDIHIVKSDSTGIDCHNMLEKQFSNLDSM